MRNMSCSPSYSPVLDVVDHSTFSLSNNVQDGTTLRENLIGDDNPITNPFYYAQDRDTWYAEVAAKSCAEAQRQKAKDLKLKRTNKKSFKNKSFVVCKELQHVRRVIKISIHDLDVCNTVENTLDSDNASVNVQYLVTSDYDDVMNETEHLIGKIVKKLGKSNCL